MVVDFHPLKIEGSVISLLVYSLPPENATLQSFTEQNLKSIQTSALKNETIKILNQNSSATLGR